MKIFSALTQGTIVLREHNIDTPRLDCEVLLAHILNCDRVKLITESRKDLGQEEYNKFMSLIEKRAAGMPAAYLTGEKEFMGLDFCVGPGVLIPRSDTEIVVEKAIEECKGFDGQINIADVCCGSGAIGISIAKYVKNSFVTLIDISGTAVSTTVKNARLNGVEERVRVVKGDLLQPVLDERYDMIVSNPPYIETDVIDTLQRDVREYEPHLALDGGPDGLKFYRKLASQARKCMKDRGIIILEIGYNQAEAVGLILEMNNFKDTEVLKDLAGNNRCVVGRKYP